MAGCLFRETTREHTPASGRLAAGHRQNLLLPPWNYQGRSADVANGCPPGKAEERDGNGINVLVPQIETGPR
jgi:hypothetical protein